MAGSDRKKFRVEIITPYRIFFDSVVEMAVITCQDGEIGVLPGHAPLVAALVPGEIRLKIDDKWLVASATKGYAEIGPEAMMIVVNAAEWPEEIDVRRAKQALARAEARIRSPRITPQAAERSREGRERAKVRLHVAVEHGSTDRIG
ncbi:MAG: ATP synthase F1 subunit epsilon [Saccharofermentanales bacterium]|jgi:F-type H+-transporting ATPase subunit epsilon|nr:ATP synthase F1 subunit epsilon [Clostridiaceae bacterium]